MKQIRQQFPIPSGTTILTLEPLDFNLLGNTLKLQLSGIPCKNNKVVKIDYPASFKQTSIDLGVDALRKALVDNPGPKLIFAHSQGAQVCSRWLRYYADQPDAPPASELSFLLIGNPLRKYGGYIIGKPEVSPKFKTLGLPTVNTTKYLVTDIKMQYDGWADWPGDNANGVAKQNARLGQNQRHCYGYLLANPSDPLRKVYAENTTDYVMLPGIPNDTNLSMLLIEAAYRRPERWFP